MRCARRFFATWWASRALQCQIDWAVKERMRTKRHSSVRRVLRKYGYPPDKQEQATQTVLEQAELFGEAWTA